MRLYCGIDLHAKSSYLAIINDERKRAFKQNVTNHRQTIHSFLAPYREKLAGVVVESTFNWYWLASYNQMLCMGIKKTYPLWIHQIPQCSPLERGERKDTPYGKE